MKQRVRREEGEQDEVESEEKSSESEKRREGAG
jgi:hypothetical protein